MEASTNTATVTAAPVTEPTVIPKPSENLTVRARARRFAHLRAQNGAAQNGTKNGNGTSSAPTKPNDPAAGQTQPTDPDPSEGETETEVAPRTPPAKDTKGTGTEAETSGEADENPLALLEDLNGGAASDSDGAAAWLRELDEVLASGDQPKAIKALQKRLHSLVDQRDTERNARLEAERRLADRSQATEQTAPTQDGLNGHPAVATIDQQIDQTLSTLELVERHLEAVSQARAEGVDVPQFITLANGQQWVDGQGRPVAVTPERAKQWLRQYENQLSQLNARRETTLVNLQQSLQATVQKNLTDAVRHYPWMKDKASAEYAEATTLLNQRPGLRMDPQWPLIVGDYIAGKRLRESAGLHATAPAMTRPKSKATPPPAPAQRAANPPAGNDLDQQIQSARQTYQGDPTPKNRAKLFALQRQQRKAA